MIVIYAEEDQFFAQGVKRAFSARGIDLVHTTNAEDVADLMVEHEPVAVLLDLRLSKLNGFELLQALKDNPRTKDVPLMVWSQLASQEDIQRCFSLGACEYFLKGQHHPHEVARHVAKRFEENQKEDGFTLPEWLAVSALFLLAVTFTFLQIQRVLDVRRDDGQLAAVRASVSAIVAAQQERALLVGCTEVTDWPIRLEDCRLCKEESCQTSLATAWEGMGLKPEYERYKLDSEDVCTKEIKHPCLVTIEADGAQPISTSAFKLRFFLVRDRDGLKGGQTHTINQAGVIE